MKRIIKILIFFLIEFLLAANINSVFAEWSIQTIDSIGDVGRNCSIAVDELGNIHICYRDNTSNNLKYAKYTETGWDIQIIDSVGGGATAPPNTSIVLDSSGNPHISYYDASYHNLKYAKSTGTKWSIETVDPAYLVGKCNSIVLDNSNKPHISYWDNVNADLKYAQWTGTYWSTETIDSDGWVGSYSSLAISTSGNLHISYFDATNIDLKYAKWTGTKWNTETADSGDVGPHTSIALDISGNPHISYRSQDFYVLKYAKWTGTKWITETVDSSYGGCGATSITIDNLNNPHIAYHYWYLKYANWTGDKWSIEAVDDTKNSGYHLSISLDGLNNPHIAYCDVKNWDLKYAMKIQTLIPIAVYNLKVIPVGNSKIKLTWKKSVSEDADKYRIYYSTVSNFIDYSEPKDTVSHPVETWTSPQLEAGKTYYFVVRTVDKTNNEEQNENVVSATVIENLAGVVKAAIKIPQNGKKVSGNRLMVMAEITVGEISDVKNVLFEYKKESDNVWQTILAANPNHTNPDFEHPYFIHWNVSGLEEGKYNIRAVVTDIQNISDAIPGYITVEIDHFEPDIEEGENADGEQERKEKIDNRKNNIIKIGDDDKNTVTQVIIPEGAISTETAKIFVIVNPNNSPEPSGKINSINEYRKIELEGAELTGEVSIIIPYKDEDNDKKVDGTDIPENTLSAFYYDESRRKWKKLTTELDLENNIVTVRTSHFTLFALFGAPADDYSNVSVYPNPFKPSKGHTYIKFDNLTVDTKMQILTLAGALVWEREDIDAGEVTWEVINQSGREVASGVYICLIINDFGEKKIVKVVVVR